MSDTGSPMASIDTRLLTAGVAASLVSVAVLWQFGGPTLGVDAASLPVIEANLDGPARVPADQSGQQPPPEETEFEHAFAKGEGPWMWRDSKLREEPGQALPDAGSPRARVAARSGGLEAAPPGRSPALRAGGRDAGGADGSLRGESADAGDLIQPLPGNGLDALAQEAGQRESEVPAGFPGPPARRPW